MVIQNRAVEPASVTSSLSSTGSPQRQPLLPSYIFFKEIVVMHTYRYMYLCIKFFPLSGSTLDTRLYVLRFLIFYHTHHKLNE